MKTEAALQLLQPFNDRLASRLQPELATRLMVHSRIRFDFGQAWPDNELPAATAATAVTATATTTTATGS